LISLRILLVDDHESVRRGLRSLLASRADWLICGEAADGLEAVEKAKLLRPNVVLMDVSMPRMGGLDATRIIRRELPDSRVVIVSQNDPAIVRRQALEVDAAAFIAKSSLPQDLLPTIDRVSNEPLPAPAAPSPTAAPSWLAGGGMLGHLIREHDWSKTPLGPVETWPQSLKTSVNLMLNSRHPMWIGWGPDMTFLYNDAYISVLSLAKHPMCLGQPARSVWSEIWDICGPLADKVFEKGEATFTDDVRFFMSRGEFLEETYYSFSYSPIHDESGKVAGLFCPSTETTAKILNARRLRTLSELAAKALLERSTDAACASSFATLAKNPDDIPFALLYLLDTDGKHAFLEQSTGVAGDIDAASPSQIDLENNSAESRFWRVDEALNAGKPEIVSLDSLASVPKGPAGQRVSEAITLPVTSRRQDRPIGVLIAGINPARKLDSEYQTFYELLAGQVATAIRNARSAEEDRKRAEALAEIDRAKTVFFSNVSHEFRTPLTLMLGPVEDLLSRSHTDLSPSAKNQLELVNRNGSRLLRLVNTLLDFSRIEAGRMQVTYEPTDLSAFTVELASVFRSATEKAGLRLELDCPKLADPVFIDRDMWEKIVLNLISNAFKFTFEGKISVSLAQAGNSVELRVRDTGVGIPANELPRLFDRFHRVQNTRSRTHEGSGIGLALVQELVRLHGGSVRVESVVGEGTTFIVSLPVGSAHLPSDCIGGARSLASTAVGASPFLEEALGWLPGAGQPAPHTELPLGFELLPVPCPPDSTPTAASEGRPRVLVADDNADMRQYLVRLLAERYDVKAFPNGQAALDSARERTPDLILTDVMMPELDGFALLRELRSDLKTSTVPIILLSARAGEEARVEGMERGADDYLIKPFSARELLARVQTHLELSRVRKENEDALRRRTAQFETLLEAAPLGVYLVDADLCILQVNPAASSALGDVADLVGRDFGEFVHTVWPKAYAAQVVERFRLTLETGEPYYVPEHIENRADRGSREFYEWQINRIPLPDGRFGVVCYFRDISRIVESREAIAESRERLRLATEAAELGIWNWNPREEHGVWENDRVYEIFGRTRDEGPLTASEFLTKVVHPDDLPAYKQALAKTIDSGARFFVQTRIFVKDGTLRWVELTGQLEPGVDGSPSRILGTVLDITDLKRTEENYRSLAETLELQVRARTEELEQRNREVLAQSAQLRDLSHRLMQTQDDERRHIARELHDSAGQTLAALAMNVSAIVDTAVRNAPQLAGPAEDAQLLVRELSQEIRTTSYLLHPPLLDEIGLSEALLVYIQGLKERSGLDVDLQIPENFGRLSREMELAIFRIVQECLTNIHRHSRNSIAHIRIARGPQGVSLEVKDEGKGISPEKLAEIQSRGGGVGIKGMRERVRQFDGHMQIESNGDGTRISFQFPIAKSASPMPESVSSASSLPPATRLQ
jgi:PAS domain S-box-containing protein